MMDISSLKEFLTISINLPSLKEFLTISAAAVGAVLGIMNTWNAISNKRLRLIVRPSRSISVPYGTLGLAIEVINMSAFPVTVSEVGLTKGSNKIGNNGRYAIINPMIIDDKPWPRRLESRESVTVYSQDQLGPDAGRAYVTTACGETRYGDSPALRRMCYEARHR